MSNPDFPRPQWYAPTYALTPTKVREHWGGGERRRNQPGPPLALTNQIGWAFLAASLYALAVAGEIEAILLAFSAAIISLIAAVWKNGE